jgi:hypothetical protein
MLASDPCPPEPALARRYLLGLAGGAALLSFYCLVNVLADPTGEFGLSGRFALNRAPPPEAIAEGEAGSNPAFYTRAIRESAASVFLIGTSRTWRGFDTCGRPELLRVAGSAWGIAELTWIQRAVLESRDRPATLLVEIGLPQDESGRIGSPLANAVSVALSPRTFPLALRTMAGSLSGRPAPAYIGCTPFPSPRADWAEAARTLRAALTYVDASPASLRRGRDNVMAMADAADRICARTGIRHRLVYFSLPPAPAGSPAPALDLIIQWNSTRLASAFADRPRPAGGCDIRYANYATDPPGPAAGRPLWRDRRFWSDYSHYGPRLGELALRTLLAAARPD